MMQHEARIFRQRERDERALAESSTSPVIRRVHERMADRYRVLLDDLTRMVDPPTR